MNIQVLVAAMNQRDYSLLDKMNIQSDVIVGNQCNRNSIDSFIYKGHEAVYLNFAEKGVGLNRNNALMRANAEICLFADDDMVYVDNYPKIIINAFTKYADADVIVFNLIEKVEKRYVIKKTQRIRFFNFLRYGTARVAIRLKSIREKGIFFNQCFGGGTEHAHGEDNIFLAECLKAKLKIYAVPIAIAELTEERKSTWVTEYNDKYLKDQGVLYKTISQTWWKMLCFQDAFRRHKIHYKMGILDAYKKMTK